MASQTFRSAQRGGQYIFDSGPSILTDMGCGNPITGDLSMQHVDSADFIRASAHNLMQLGPQSLKFRLTMFRHV